MAEYAISDGEGTLIDYGIVYSEAILLLTEEALLMGRTSIFGPCSDDCETGQ